MNQVILSIVFFVLGFILGYIVRDLMSKVKEAKASNLIMILVALMWAVSVIADVLLETYETPVYIHLIMGGIVGFFFKFSVTGITQNSEKQ